MESSVLIVDQSKHSWEKAKNYPLVKYIHLPSKKYNFYEMWKEVIDNQVSTPYICWNNDDDFTTPDYIDQATDFLNKNKNYTFVTGETLQYGNEMYGKLEWLKEEKLKPIESISQRIETYFDGLFANPHVVVRKSVVHKAVSDILESVQVQEASLAPIKFWDKIFNFYALTLGNKKTLRCLATVRCNRHSQAKKYTGTGTLMTILKEYPSVLEKDTPYSEIINRIDKSQIVSNFFKENSSQKIDVDQFINKVFSYPLGLSGLMTEDEIKTLPSKNIEGQEEINIIEKFINNYSND